MAVAHESGPDVAGMRVVLDHLPDIAQVYDRSWRWCYLNPAARAIAQRLGLEPDELVGQVLWDVFPNASTQPEFERALRQQTEVVLEESLARLDAILETRIVPIPGGVLTLTRDVTPRRTLEENLARENTELDLERRRLRAILELLPVGVWIADAHGRVIETNAAAAEIWGGRAPLSRRAEDFHLDYRGWWASTGEALGPGDWGLARAVRDGTTTLAQEIDIECFDGSRRTVLNYALPIRNAQRDIIGAAALTVDITERKQQERLQQVTGEAAAVLGATLDPEQAFQSLADLCVQRIADVAVIADVDEEGEWRRRAARHRDPTLQTMVEPLLRHGTGPTSAHPLRSLVESGEPLLLGEIDAQTIRTLSRNTHEQRLLTLLELTSVIVVPLRARDRTIGTLTLGTVRSGRQQFAQDDLSVCNALASRAALAIDNARLYHRAQAASQAKSQFLATMSHELRTPLTAIIGYDELLLNEVMGPLSARQRQQLERIRISAWHLVTIIDQILTFSRAEAGRETVHAEPTNVALLLQETSALLEPQAQGKQITLQAHSPDRPVWVRTDPGKLRQILLNLGGNAIKFTPHGRVDIELTEAGDDIVFEIRDTGPGIVPADRDRIFEPFTQLDQSNTRAQGGTGLGLTVSRRLARLLGGDITVDGKEGGGAVFRLALPRLG